MSGDDHKSLNVLRYRLYEEGSHCGNHFSETSAANLLHSLFTSVWGKQEQLFLSKENRPKITDWNKVDNRGKRWSMAEAQQKDERLLSKRKGKICGNYLARGDRCFNCKTCAIDNTSVLCSECFFASDHTGHDVTFGVAYSFSGYCDCGDPSSWSRPTDCPLHPAEPDDNQPSSSSIHRLPPSKDIPELRLQAVRETVELAFDFIIQTFEAGPVEGNLAVPRTIEEVIYETQGSRAGKGKAKLESVSLVLWSDEKHTAKEVVRQIIHATGQDKVQAQALAAVLEREGRVVVETSEDYHRLIHVAQTLSQIDLTATFHLSAEAYREQCCGIIIPWIADLCSSSVAQDDLVLRRTVGEVLLNRSKVSIGQTPESRSKLVATRLERLFLVFSRFWKAPRIAWMKMFVRILTADMHFKIALGNTFARMYTYLVDQYLFFDRETELSLLLWGMQLFPVPLIAEAAVREMDMLHTLLQVLTSYFTEQFEHQHLRIPPTVVPRIDADVDSFRTKKWQTMFGHLKVVLQSRGVQRYLLEQPEAFNETVSFLSLFTAMAPHLRARSEHIEYESDAWIRALGVTMDLSRVTVSLGAVYDEGDREAVIRAITEIGLHISYNTRLLSTVLDSDKFYPPTRHDIHILGEEFAVIQQDLDVEWVSIHNPLHWLMAEIMKRLPRITDEDVDINDVKLWMTASNADVDQNTLNVNVQTTLEYPLRTVAYMAQVRAGLWVRNGIGMRGQLHHYRDHPLRETTYDQDLFLLQLGFCVLDPGVMLASMIDRFGLKELFGSPHWTDEVSPQTLQLLEELLLCVITLFSETWSMRAPTKAENTRREVIHILCLGPLAFSDLVKRLSEKTVEIANFKEILEEVATLRPVKGVTETGVYQLKDGFFAEVNPLFFHYSRNQQNEAYETLCKHRKVDVIGMKPPFIIEDAFPFNRLLQVFSTGYIVRMIRQVISNVMRIRSQAAPIAPQLDGALDLTFHLASLALACNKENTAQLICQAEDNRSLLDDLCEVEHNKDWAQYRPRISRIIDLVAKQQGEKVRSVRARKSMDRPAISNDEARKAVVAKRKQAIMAGFAKNQMAFAEAYSVDDEDDDDEDEAVSFGPCIVCQEDCTEARPSGLLGMVQPSKVLRNMAVGRDWYEECLRVPEVLDEDTRKQHFGFGTDGRPVTTDSYPIADQRLGLNVSVCGHLMHEQCLFKFSKDTELRQSLQGQRNHPENAYRKEFLCPLCKSVGNILVPLTNNSKPNNPPAPLAEWIRRVMDEDLRRQGDANGRDLYQATGERLQWFAEAVKPETEVVDMAKRYQEIIRSVSQQTSHLHGRTELGLYVPKDIVGYTLSMMEASRRGVASSEESAAYLNESSERLLRGLLTLLEQDLGDIDPGSRRINIFAQLLPKRFRARSTSSALLLRDPLSVVIETAVEAPDVLQPVIVLCYYAELVRAMLAITFWSRLCSTRAPSPGWRQDIDAVVSGEIFPSPRALVLGCFRGTPQLLQEATSALYLISERDLSKLLYTFTLPFLRRCSMLCSAIKVSFSTMAGGSTLLGGPGGEYTKHLRRLRIPTPSTTISDPDQSIQPAVASWLEQWMQLDTGLPILEFPGIYELYRVPESLEMLLRENEKRECGKCMKVPMNPAVCFLCGEYLCLGTDCCAEGNLGECNLHRMECGGAVGIFIDLKRWAVLYLYAGSGSFGPMPFLDCHGEVDQGMRRGHPQFQHQPRADHLRRLWLNHGVPSFVARKLELTLDQSGWDSM